jgi:hypothetical protein
MGLSPADQHAETVFRQHRGVLRTSRALALGIHPRTLYPLRDSGRLVPVSRGVYRLADLPEPSQPGLVVVATRAPQAIVCLISALAFSRHHHAGAPRGPDRAPSRATTTSARPSPDPRLQADWQGLQRGRRDPFNRGGLGLLLRPGEDGRRLLQVPEPDRARCRVEALRLSRERRRASVRALLHYAHICRVERVIQPYIEALQ